MHKPIRIAITPGEPAGIGPELVLKLAQQALSFEIVAIANLQLLRKLTQQLEFNIEIDCFNPNSEISTHSAGKLSVVDVPLAHPVESGRLYAKNSSYVIETLNTAIELINNNTCQALTTGPVQKSIINDAGISFSGHTEFIAEKTGGYPVMMLVNDSTDNPQEHNFRVALVTTHLPISEVSPQITPKRIEDVLQVLHKDLIQRFGISSPRICVCGLNPHAGERRSPRR